MSLNPMTPPYLKEILKGVSRSFYLTLWVLPPRVRPQISVAYLFCRAADTIADTPLIPPSGRLKILNLFRDLFRSDSVSPETLEEIREAVSPGQGDSREKQLLLYLPDCFRAYLEFSGEDRDRIRMLVSSLTAGMEMDLDRFPGKPGEPPTALKDETELDQYCYYVAGVVGEFWTRMMAAHFPSLGTGTHEEEMRVKGIRFGKGLQMTNILKDLSKDLARGRCYLPLAALERSGLKPGDLVGGLPADRTRSLLSPFIRLALDHLEEGWRYIMMIPRGEFRLRLACLWPHLFAVKTLKEIYESPSVLDPEFTVKISRAGVYGTMIQTGLMCFSNEALTGYFEGLKRKLHLAAESA